MNNTKSCSMSSGECLYRCMWQSSNIGQYSIHFYCFPDETKIYTWTRRCLSVYKTCTSCRFKGLGEFYFSFSKYKKAEFVVLGPELFKDSLGNITITLDGSNLEPLLFFYHLCNIYSFRNILSQNSTEKIVHSCVSWKVNCCNSLLLGCS